MDRYFFFFFFVCVFFFNDTATTEIYTLSLHDALPISVSVVAAQSGFDSVISVADGGFEYGVQIEIRTGIGHKRVFHNYLSFIEW